ncbi:carboxypeptidase M32 [Salinirubellus salinus]|uniref:Metal-dependent carboxypeptidase n=1 Tax=Salinirubellus salinus TaxID=1364945 RepID=A0A9E7U9E7_9EURY|nr:carboxypeptidase M32 [Salinirubellus salinus]UWM53178.1 carboxypeptidase M32 [Salinirubellus salinus]
MATEQGQLPDAYDEVLEQFARVTYLSDGGSYLNWDQEVMMPDDGTPARAKQLSTISGVHHDLLTDDVVADGLDELDESELPQPQAAEVREVRRQYDRAAKVPRDLVERISEETSNALPVWKEAKAESDWSTFAPKVETLLDLKREYAEHIDPDADPYAVLFADYEPYLDLSVAEDVLTTLRDELVPLIDDIKASDTELADPFDGAYSDDTQMALCRSLLDTLGYDWDRGRIDVAPHPFSLGTQFDARVTTRFDEEDPVGAIGSTIHEFGHATYTLGLPQEHYGSPLGQHRGLTVHESQSRLMENHVGRSRAFWDLVTDDVNDHLGTEVTPQAGYEAANQIYPENRIRVEADELTYHMHIVLRFEIERDLLAGDLDVEEVPAVWNEKMEEYLGVTPDDDAEGCLQDIHWSHGSFGYFSTYSLGSVLAAQLFAAAEDDIADLDGKIRNGEFGPLHDWLTENVHAHGQRYETNDLVREATGSGFSADPFVEYATAKFGDLYDL